MISMTYVPIWLLRVGAIVATFPLIAEKKAGRVVVVSVVPLMRITYVCVNVQKLAP